jgi:hypothetical protein
MPYAKDMSWMLVFSEGHPHIYCRLVIYIGGYEQVCLIFSVSISLVHLESCMCRRGVTWHDRQASLYSASALLWTTGFTWDNIMYYRTSIFVQIILSTWRRESTGKEHYCWYDGVLLYELVKLGLTNIHWNSMWCLI